MLEISSIPRPKPFEIKPILDSLSSIVTVLTGFSVKVYVFVFALVSTALTTVNVATSSTSYTPSLYKGLFIFI